MFCQRTTISSYYYLAQSFSYSLNQCLTFLHELCSQFPTCFNIEIMTISEPLAGFAFVYMEDERDAADAIRRLDRFEFGRKGRQLRVEWTKEERDLRRSGSSRRSSGNMKPSKTLFVINFDPINTRTRDLERHFEIYGKILNVRVRRNFAFVQFEDQEDANRALEATNLSKFMDRVITVEYAVRGDDDDNRRGDSYNNPDRRGRDASSPRRGGYDRRSPSPLSRRGGGRASPDYGHGGSNLNSRSNPNYERSPLNDRYPPSRSISRSPPPPRDRSRS